MGCCNDRAARPGLVRGYHAARIRHSYTRRPPEHSLRPGNHGQFNGAVLGLLPAMDAMAPCAAQPIWPPGRTFLERTRVGGGSLSACRPKGGAGGWGGEGGYHFSVGGGMFVPALPL